MEKKWGRNNKKKIIGRRRGGEMIREGEMEKKKWRRYRKGRRMGEEEI